MRIVVTHVLTAYKASDHESCCFAPHAIWVCAVVLHSLYNLKRDNAYPHCITCRLNTNAIF